MSKWTHYLCCACYDLFQPGINPVRLRDPETALCCFCKETHRSGIYYRDDPANYQCKGKHDGDPHSRN